MLTLAWKHPYNDNGNMHVLLSCFYFWIKVVDRAFWQEVAVGFMEHKHFLNMSYFSVLISLGV